MTDDCWTCALDDNCDESLSNPKVLAWVGDWCSFECKDKVCRPPKDGVHPDCPGHRGKDEV